MIQLYIATSLDGYIAKNNDSVDWLDEMPHPEGEDYGYEEFYSGVDTVIMGRKTYDVVVGFGVEWPYSDCKTYVVTRDQNFKGKLGNPTTINDLSPETIREIRNESRKNIWLVGGGRLVAEFLNQGWIDEMIISLMPVVLGEGIPLFPPKIKESWFSLEKSRSYDSGAVILSYRKK